MKDNNVHVEEAERSLKKKEKFSELIILYDLFQTNDALVAPLLRLKDNNVHVEEAERSLKKKEKFSELIILYEKKGLHEKGETVHFKP